MQPPSITPTSPMDTQSQSPTFTNGRFSRTVDLTMNNNNNPLSNDSPFAAARRVGISTPTSGSGSGNNRISPRQEYEESAALGEGSNLPNALSSFPAINREFTGHHLAIFLDYDGTLTPIVSDPAAAIMTDQMRQTVHRVSKRFITAVVTGRRIETITEFVRLHHIYYAGSHGFDIHGPNEEPLKAVAEEFLPALQQFYTRVSERGRDIEGCLVEDNKFSISVHYRKVNSTQDLLRIQEIVDAEIAPFADKLEVLPGKCVHEIRPKIDWHKGKAVEYLIDLMFPDVPADQISAVYCGDDRTDEDAFIALNEKFEHSVTVFVRPPDKDRPSKAKYVLDSTEDVQQFLTKIAECDL